MGSAALSLLPPYSSSSSSLSSSSSFLLISRRRPRRSSSSHCCIVPVARLFGPAMFEASKLKVLFLGVGVRVGVGGEKHTGATYTLTHGDITSKPVSDTINRAEDYKEAARIRDNLRSFEAEEPVLHLRGLMKKAIEEQRFEDAARYRDELRVVAPYSLLKCSSDATTLGIRVQVRSVYIERRSQPSKEQYFFAYRIRITNNSLRPVQLLRRHWIITDANGKTENFWGVGVIGEQPVIHPKTGFEYSSACPLRTPNGRMEGDFEMKHIDKVGAPTFNIAIAPFSLAILGDDTEGLA